MKAPNKNTRRFLSALLLLTVLASAWLGFRSKSSFETAPQEEEEKFLGKLSAPILSPGESIKKMQLPSGFEVKLVASEPLVEDPVSAVFDPDGRLWVVEMRGYMNDTTGRGENSPVGRVVVLENPDPEGAFTKRTVFLDGLVLPRSLTFVEDGVLVGAPPYLYFWRDTNGDLVADEKTLVSDKFGDPEVNPEYQPNGLMRNIDNWIYGAYFPERLRRDNGNWILERTLKRGQWGMAQDNQGRLFYNFSFDPLRADLIPYEYWKRNPYLDDLRGVNDEMLSDIRVWPGHKTPSANDLADIQDGVLHVVTSAGGAQIYRGQLFSKEYRGNAFVCEPVGNMIKRILLQEEGGELSGRNAYVGKEFLTSSDERFRPVNLSQGPDGALYMVDMYRGLILHKTFLGDRLRKQAAVEGYTQGIHRGRIYKIIPKRFRPQPVEKLSKKPPSDLIALLDSPNGWIRDTVQRLLVERRDPQSISLLEKKIRSRKGDWGALHALWSLSGMNKLNPSLLEVARAHRFPEVRAAAVRLSLEEPVSALSKDPSPGVQLQVLLTTGSLEILKKNEESSLFRDGWLTGVAGKEKENLELLLKDPHFNSISAARKYLLMGLSQSISRRGVPSEMDLLLSLALSQGVRWKQDALLSGILRGREDLPLLRLDVMPVGLIALSSSQAETHGVAERVLKKLSWPGWKGFWAERIAEPFARSKVRVERFFSERVRRWLPGSQSSIDYRGKRLFGLYCAVCHQVSGRGRKGLIPPLVGSEWVRGDKSILVRILLNGVQGPLSVREELYRRNMPGFSSLSDENISLIASYIRREFSQTEDWVDAALVGVVRGKRDAPWTEAELRKFSPALAP